MADPEQLARLQKSIKKWNEWRAKHHDIRPGLRGANLRGANLRAANFRGADLGGVNLREADLSGANLGGAHLGGADLGRANLGGANFGGANLLGVDLGGADLRRAGLYEAGLRAANFRGADLGLADLRRANLGGAHLGGANLREADLFGAELGGASLLGADLNAARVGWSVFANVDLSGVLGLETIHHEAPSTIGIDTIYKSGGKLPEVFLRGAGVPETFITYAASLVGNPIEFYSCFISYSTKDQKFADRLHADLQAKGVRCWFAPHQVAGGKKLHEQIDEAIRLYDRLLLILSDHSIESEWVKTEIAKALKREIRENRRMLFPLRLVEYNRLRDWECFDADTGKDSAREIREYFIPNFSHWKDHDSYTKALEQLLRDLKAADHPVEPSARSR